MSSRPHHHCVSLATAGDSIGKHSAIQAVHGRAHDAAGGGCIHLHANDCLFGPLALQAAPGRTLQHNGTSKQPWIMIFRADKQPSNDPLAGQLELWSKQLKLWCQNAPNPTADTTTAMPSAHPACLLIGARAIKALVIRVAHSQAHVL